MGEQILDEEFWNEYAKLYAHFTPSFQKELLEHISQKSFGKVGDFGTGTGKLYRHLKNNENITELIGMDASPQMIEIAKKEAKKHLSHIPYRIIQNDLNQIQTQNNFDSIYLINVIYANNNPIDIIEKTAQKLNKGSNLIIVDMQRKVQGEKLLEQLQKEYRGEDKLQKYLSDNKLLMGDSTPSTYNLRELEKIISLVDDFTIIESSDEFYLNSANYVLARKN